MKTLLLIFIIILFLNLNVNGLTKFHFEAKLSCVLKKHYQYFLEHLEHDPFSANDLIGEIKKGIVEGDVVVLASGEQINDGVGNTNYEVFAKIKHNCTSTGTFKSLKIDLGKVLVKTPEVTLKYTAILYNNSSNV